MTTQREIPILFQGDMVRAILEDRKTLTSRLAGLELVNEQPDAWEYRGATECGVHCFDCDERPTMIRCPYGTAGDLLWVRETFRHISDMNGDSCVQYRADGKALASWASDNGEGDWVKVEGEREPIKFESKEPPWKPSIHIPRWACRILLEVVKVWPSRVQDMTEEMAVQEGVKAGDLITSKGFLGPFDVEMVRAAKTALEAYSALWDRINGKEYLWEKNPWVWRVQFRRVKP